MQESKSLISLVHVVSSLEEKLIESNGEITEEIEKSLVIKDTSLPEKMDSYALVIDRMDSISKFYKDKAEFYLKLAKSANFVVDRCKHNIKESMILLGIDELEGFDVRFKLTPTSPTCVIEDESKIPETFLKKEIKIDKKELVQVLKSGVLIEGARLEENKALRMYPNSPKKLKGKK